MHPPGTWSGSSCGTRDPSLKRSKQRSWRYHTRNDNNTNAPAPHIFPFRPDTQAPPPAPPSASPSPCKPLDGPLKLLTAHWPRCLVPPPALRPPSLPLATDGRLPRQPPISRLLFHRGGLSALINAPPPFSPPDLNKSPLFHRFFEFEICLLTAGVTELGGWFHGGLTTVYNGLPAVCPRFARGLHGVSGDGVFHGAATK